MNQPRNATTSNLITPRSAPSLLQALRHTHDVEIDCDEFLAYVAAYAEDPSRIDDLRAKMAEHERLCASCKEELEALREALR